MDSSFVDQRFKLRVNYLVFHVKSTLLHVISFTICEETLSPPPSPLCSQLSFSTRLSDILMDSSKREEDMLDWSEKHIVRSYQGQCRRLVLCHRNKKATKRNTYRSLYDTGHLLHQPTPIKVYNASSAAMPPVSMLKEAQFTAPKSKSSEFTLVTCCVTA